MADELRSALSALRLTGADNFAAWKYQIEIALNAKDLWDFVSGDKTAPTVPSRQMFGSDDEYQDSLELYEKEEALFKKGNAQALFILTCALDTAHIMRINTLKTAKAVYEAICTLYEPANAGNRCSTLFTKLYTITYKPGDDVLEMVQQLRQVYDQLVSELERTNEQPFHESHFIHRVLAALPSEYTNLIDSWHCLKAKEKTYAALYERIRNFTERQKQFNGENEDRSHALTVQKKIQNKKYFNKDWPRTPGAKCHYCKKSGHTMEQCMHLKKKNSKQLNEATKGHTDSEGAKSKHRALMVTNQYENPDYWIADTGASLHITCNKGYYASYKPFAAATLIKAGGRMLPVHGTGTIFVQTLVNGKWEDHHLDDVHYCPELGCHLYSLGTAVERGLNYTSVNRQLYIRDAKGFTYIVGDMMRNRIYKLRMRVRVPRRPVEINLVSSENTLQVWHERLAHQNKRHVVEVLKGNGLSVKNSTEEFCIGCVQGKSHRKHFGSRQNRPTTAGEQINVDLAGPFPVESPGGSRYFVVFKDDYTKFRRIYFIRQKSEVSNKLRNFLVEAERSGITIKSLRTDQGTEINNADVRRLLENCGIRIYTACVQTPQQNGGAEREIRTIEQAARSMLNHKKLPEKLWAEACNTAVEILNHTGPSPTKGKSPFELWTGRQSTFNLSRLRIFGTTCHYLVPKNKRSKWKSKTRKALLVGYEHVDGWRVYDPARNTVEVSCEVTFESEQLTIENSNGRVNLPELNIDKQVTDPDQQDHLLLDPPADDDQQDHLLLDPPADDGKADGVNCDAVKHDPDHIQQLVTRSGRLIRRPAWFGDFVVNCVQEPTSYAEAISSEYYKAWKKAMDEEINSLEENSTWELTDLPPGKTALSGRWIYRAKSKADGSQDRLKARYVARGYAQRPGIDYDELYSPVARYDTVRTILAIAAAEQLHLKQFDVKTAFLYGDIEEELYMEQPEGYGDGTNRVCRLLKSLYGLKQAPRCWNTRFVKFMQHAGFEQSNADPSLFICRNGDRKVLLVLYVDDGLIAATHKEDLEDLLVKLQDEFKITVNEPESFLGMQIKRLENGSIWLGQVGYTERILKWIGLHEANPVATPSIKKLAEDSVGAALPTDVPYREALGRLQYLATSTHPDIAFAVNRAARSSQDKWPTFSQNHSNVLGF